MNRCRVRVITSSSSVILNYLRSMGVNLYQVRIYSNSIILLLDSSSLKILGNLCEYEILNDYRLHGLVIRIVRNWYSYFLLVSFLVTICILTSFIISIDISVLNKDVREKILSDLEEVSIYPFSFSKSDLELNSIKHYLLEENKDTIEWLNIRRVGMKYVIDVTLKKDKLKNEEATYCNIVSKKDAIISRIHSSSGVEMVEQNDFVSDGELLISGDVIYNNNHTQVCAKGVVYGKVWYTVFFTIPKSKMIRKELSKSRNNFGIRILGKEFVLFKNRISDPIIKKKRVFSFFGIEFYSIREIQGEDVRYTYQNQEIDDFINREIRFKMDQQIDGDYRILKRNVLKKVDNDSTMDIEVFIVTEEEIGVTS